MDVRADHKEGWVSAEELMLLNLVLEKTLKSPLDWKETKPVNAKGINPEYSLEELMLKLKLHYYGHLMWRAISLEETPMLGKIKGKRAKRVASFTQWT